MSCKKTNYETKKEVNSLWIGTAINEKQGKVLSDNVIEALNEDGDDDVKTIEDALLYLNEKAGTGGGGAPGKDGFSPTVSINKVDKQTTVTITDKSGEHTATINDGIDGTNGTDGQPGAKGDKGEDGVSPTISAVRVSNGVQLTITDKNGSHSAVLNDGIGDGSSVATFADVPNDGKSYLRQNGIWVEGTTKQELAEIGSKVGEIADVVGKPDGLHNISQTYNSAWVDYALSETIKQGDVITSIGTFNGTIYLKDANGTMSNAITKSALPFSVPFDAVKTRSNTGNSTVAITYKTPGSEGILASKASVGDLSQLHTTAKSSVVDAINELAEKEVDVDATLSQAGKAGDAKAIGDKLSEINDELAPIMGGQGGTQDVTAQIGTKSRYISTAGQKIAYSSSGNPQMSNPFYVKKGQIVEIKGRASSSINYMLLKINVSTLPKDVLESEDDVALFSGVVLTKPVGLEAGPSSADTAEVRQWTADSNCYLVATPFFSASYVKITTPNRGSLVDKVDAIDDKVTSVESAIEDLQNQSLETIGQVADLQSLREIEEFTTAKKSGYVNYSNGVIGASSNNHNYTIELDNAMQSIQATCYLSDNVSASIAFYSTNEVDATSYIKSASVQGKAGENTYSANIPENAKIVVITNRTQIKPNPTIRIFGNTMGIAIEKANTAQDIALLSMPYYVFKGAERVVVDLWKHINKGEDVVSVAFTTDQHVESLSSTSYATRTKPVINGLHAMRHIAESAPLDMIVFGGDFCGYLDKSFLETTESIPHIANEIGLCCSHAETSATPALYIAGNHDCYNAGTSNSYGKFIKKMLTDRNSIKKDGVVSANESVNCYYDNNDKKIRFIVVDGYTRNYAGSLLNEERITFLRSSLADSKLINSDWKVLIFSHNVIPPAGSDTQNITQPMGASVWAEIQSAQSRGVKILACINGHAHYSQQRVVDGINCISTSQSASHTPETSYDGIKYIPEIGKETETAFDVYVFNLTTNKIYSYRYGNGMDRVFDDNGIMLCNLSGVVTNYPSGAKIETTHNNTKYSVTLSGDGSFSFPFLGVEMEWRVKVINGAEVLYETDYVAEQGQHTLNISIP